MAQVGVVIEGLDGTGGRGHRGTGWHRWAWHLHNIVWRAHSTYMFWVCLLLHVQSH